MLSGVMEKNNMSCVKFLRLKCTLKKYTCTLLKLNFFQCSFITNKTMVTLLNIQSALNLEGFKVPCNIAIYTQS